jgi:glycosyltransferase involved in cell wall biosynthesis
MTKQGPLTASAAGTVRAVDVCTIIAKNYVAQARVLARSFAEHHPDGRFWTLIIDDFADSIDPAREPFTVLTPADIGCEPFADMAVRYNVLELSTAVKPWLLRHLMAEVQGPITYLDPDIQVFGSLEELERLAIAHGLVLTPHNSEPIPHDGKKPSQIDIMIAGVYNLGYVSLAPGAEIDKLLDWWSDRLRRDCRVDPVYGYFVDQRWFDLAPGFVSDYAIMREPQYNIAYWNLHSRELAHDGERYTVDGRPLAFFHFSGFDPEDPAVLSRHQDRIDLAGYPLVRRILGEYAEAARKEGYGLAKEWPYTFDRLADGTPLDPVVRKLYIEAEARGELSSSPFGADGAEALLEWLGARAPDGPPGVSRLLAHIYAEREDLRAAFPDLDGSGLGGLLEWSQNGGREEIPVLGRLPLTEGAEQAAVVPQRPTRTELWGVNVVGYFRSELGVGEAARQVVTALDAAGVPTLAVHGATLPLSRQGHTYTQSDYRDAQFPVNLICVNADMLPDFANRAGERFFAGRYSIGLWFWEVSRFREEWQGSFDLLDEVWAPTAHVAEALAPISPIPVVPMRIPVEMPPIVPRSRAELGVPEGFFFLFSFDYLSVFERKNPLALVEAFTRAFDPGEGPSLVLKCINAERDPAHHEQLLAAIGERPDVHLIDRYLTPSDKNTLTATCDCYVSLHRSEGYGLTMAEAMYLGKPVIATGYSGNLDFMTPENGLLVDYELVPIGPGAPVYPADGEWADPNVEHAAELMRLVFDDPAAAAALGARAAQDIHRTHSPEAAGILMERRLEHLRRLGLSGRHAAVDGGRSMVVDSLAPRVKRGPVAGPSTKVGPAGGVARRGALRLMRPFTAYQETVNAEVVRSLDTISDEVTDQIESLNERLVRANAMILGQLRSHEGTKALPAVIEAQSRAVEAVQGALTELGGRVDQLDRAFQDEHALETDRALYTALALLAERHRSISEQPGASAAAGSLAPHELRVFSQNGEDGVLAEILARVGVGERFFVEFGVESGREGNCVYLADVAGWQGLFMDCDDDFFAELERKYRVEDRVRTVRAMITPENVQELFAANGVPAELDVLSIDVDGADYWIWEAIDAYRPRVVVIEYNSALDPLRRLVQPADLEGGWDGTSYYGASLGALRAIGERKGYRLVHTELSGVNAFFVREDLAEGRFLSPEEVPRRGKPNYFQRGQGHPPDLARRRYLDLDSGELVEAEPSLGSGANGS